MESDGASAQTHMRFDDNALLAMLFGEHDRHIAQIEHALGVMIGSRGNELEISGPSEPVSVAKAVLSELYDKLKQGQALGSSAVDGAIRMAGARGPGSGGEAASPARIEPIQTRKNPVSPRSLRQAAYIDAMRTHELVFGLGPAGTGKTYIAVAVAVSMYLSGQVDRIILSRPAVEAGERLGFLPGDIKEKVDPYLRPLYDALNDMMPTDAVLKRIESGDIEIAPLAFMRGRTLANAIVILDEAQNTTPVQMKMFLTRLGEYSRMVVTGDLSQIDLPISARSGLAEAVDTLENVQGAAFIRFSNDDVVRNPLVTRIVRAYEKREKEANTARGGEGRN
ncbi:MAG: PhoH family protein [Alphaproteobacteria bacterium]